MHIKTKIFVLSLYFVPQEDRSIWKERLIERFVIKVLVI